LFQPKFNVYVDLL